MAMTSPIRIDDELYKSASIVGPVMSRSASQQVQHWARIGRELEEADMAAGAIAAVLAGARSYDDIDARQQAIVRAEWEERVASRIHALDLEGGIGQCAGRGDALLGGGRFRTGRGKAGVALARILDQRLGARAECRGVGHALRPGMATSQSERKHQRKRCGTWHAE